MEQLRTCPFCGGEAKIVFAGRIGHLIQCKSCKNMTPWKDTEAEAVKAWNRRDLMLDFSTPGTTAKFLHDEFYTWHKGDELPDRECDCVVVFEGDVGTYPTRPTTLAHVYLEDSGWVVRDDENGYEIPPDAIIAWLPFELPKEAR